MIRPSWLTFAPPRAMLSAVWLLSLVSICAAPRVVINEVNYHPANDDDRMQYVELHNAGDAEADLSGWKLRGVKFDFPAKTRLRVGEFLVIARDTQALQRVHGTSFPVIGNLPGRIKRGGEKLELVDANGQVVESFTFSDDPPWPLGPDGYASTLERICPTAPASEPGNWAASKRATRNGREGTPGRANSSASVRPLPRVEQVKWEKFPAPNKALSVAAVIRSDTDIANAAIEYYTYDAGGAGAKTNLVEFLRTSGNGRDGGYQAMIPGQAAGTLIRFVVKTTSNASVATHPSPNEPRPAFSAMVIAPPQRGRIPAIEIMNIGRVGRAVDKMQPARDDLPEVGSSAVLYVPPTGDVQLFDFASVRHRSGGYKVHFLKDQLLDGMSSINLVAEGPPRWMLAEHLSYELFRRAGMAIQNSGHCRVTVDGRSHNYMLWVEQPNKTFLARTGRSNEGNLYKIRWFERDITGAHEKKTNPTTGHSDIASTINELNKLSGEAQWKFIQQNFNLTNFINYYAVNMCVQNWDGFFNNHYVYRDTKPGSKWEVIPWDEDKTWGDYDGASSQYDWYDMPLTSGMNGDRMTRSGFGFGGGGPFGGTSWWRPAGWFSGPLLANPQFRKAFLLRLKELCETTFTEEKFLPVIENMKAKVRPEVPKHGLAQFDSDIESFRRQLTNRRKFILKEVARELK